MFKQGVLKSTVPKKFELTFDQLNNRSQENQIIGKDPSQFVITTFQQQKTEVKNTLNDNLRGDDLSGIFNNFEDKSIISDYI